jgi:hypothetical protein
MFFERKNYHFEAASDGAHLCEGWFVQFGSCQELTADWV